MTIFHCCKRLHSEKEKVRNGTCMWGKMEDAETRKW